MALEEENYLRLKDIDEPTDDLDNYQNFSASIIIIPTSTEADEKLLSTYTGDFAKWIKCNNDDIKIETLPHDKKIELRSEEFWLPLVFLGQDIALPVYLNMVSSYLYEKTKGALATDRNRVSLSAKYFNKHTGTYKEFNFKGSADSFQKNFKKIDMNKFYDE